MSLPLLMNLIDESCKSGSITTDTKNYLLKKATEFNISSDLVEKIISAKNVNIIESKENKEVKESVFSSVNSTIRKAFEDSFSRGDYDTIIDTYQERFFNTSDYQLIEIYLKSLLNKKEFDKAYNQIENIKERLASDFTKIYAIIGDIYLNVKKFDKAFDVFYSLLEDNITDSQEKLDLLVNKVLNDGQFDLIDRCRKSKNYLDIAKEKLIDFYEEEKYLFYIKLFEADFQDDDCFVKNYIWSLYNNDSTEKKAYEKGTYYISKISNSETLSYVMALTCSYLEMWIESYDYFKICLLRDKDVQEDIDKIIDKLIAKNEWEILSNFKDSLNYDYKIKEAFRSLNYSDDYENVVRIFESLFLETTNIYIIQPYIRALKNTDFTKCLKKYKEFDSLFDSDDASWIYMVGTIHEENEEYETALNFYEKAESIDVGSCTLPIIRMNYVLHPEMHFKDYYDDENYLDAITIFESKLKKTTDIDIIVAYITSLYRNKGTEEKGLELGILYSKSNPDGEKLFRTIGFICKYLEKYSQAKEYFTKAKIAGYNVDEELQEINMIIAKAEEEAQEMPKAAYKLETFEEYNQKLEEEEGEENERRRKQLLEEAIKRMAEQDEENEKEINEKQDLTNQKIGSHHFINDWKRGGDVFLQEHIYVNDDEVTWEKKKNLLFGKNSITIPIDKVSIELEVSLIGTDIIIRGNGFSQIKGTNFKKSDAKKIESLILKAQRKK